MLSVKFDDICLQTKPLSSPSSSIKSPFFHTLLLSKLHLTIMLPLLLLFGLLLLLLLCLQWRHPNHHLLPPGSMGWPYIGETFKLYTQNPNSFFSIRQKRYSKTTSNLFLVHILTSFCCCFCRYGDVFKTHILGCPCVMISSPEAARVVLVSKAHLFKPTYPPSKEKMIGPQALFFHQGPYHSRLKKLIQASFLPSAIKPSVSQIENIVLRLLPSWDNSQINTLQQMKRVFTKFDFFFFFPFLGNFCMI